MQRLRAKSHMLSMRCRHSSIRSIVLSLYVMPTVTQLAQGMSLCMSVVTEVCILRVPSAFRP